VASRLCCFAVLLWMASPARLSAQAEPSGPPEPPLPEDLPIIEVTVHGEQPEPTVTSYSRGEVRQLPGAFGDPFRAVESQPGVTPIASGLPFFYVRGAPPGNVGYVLDGVPVPYLFHVGAGPSVVQPALIERVDLYRGGYPARFGRYAGGMVAAEATEPSYGVHGEGTLRLFDAGGYVEGTFDEDRGSLMLGGRYAYPGALLSLAAPQWRLEYHDFQSRAAYDLSPRDRVSVLAFGSYDLLAEKRPERLDIFFGSEFYRADVRYDRSFEQGSVRTAVTLGYGRTWAGLLVPEDPRHVADRSIAVRSELETDVGPSALLRAGVSVAADRYDVEGAHYGDPDHPDARLFEERFPERTDYVAGGWLDWTLELSPHVQLMPGLRADIYGSLDDRAVGIDPRIAARFEVLRGLRLIPAFGVAHQTPSFIVPLPGISPPLGSGLQRAVQSSAAVELDLDEDTTAGSAVFYNLFSNMTDGFDASGGNPNDTTFDARRDGSALGAELFLRRRLNASVGGFVSYTLSRSVRDIDGVTLPSAFDRTHVLNAALSLSLGAGWRAGSHVLVYSGTPLQPQWNEDAVVPVERVVREQDLERTPVFFRLDVRLEKRWTLGDYAFLSLVIEALNATLSKETWPGGERIGPITLPSIGLEGGF
jgi:hypothetical protein